MWRALTRSRAIFKSPWTCCWARPRSAPWAPALSGCAPAISRCSPPKPPRTEMSTLSLLPGPRLARLPPAVKQTMLMLHTAGHPAGGAARHRQDVPGQGDGGRVRRALLQRKRRRVRGDVPGHSCSAHPLAVSCGAQGRALHSLHRWVPAAADTSVALRGAHGGVLVAYLHHCRGLLHRDKRS